MRISATLFLHFCCSQFSFLRFGIPNTVFCILFTLFRVLWHCGGFFTLRFSFLWVIAIHRQSSRSSQSAQNSESHFLCFWVHWEQKSQTRKAKPLCSVHWRIRFCSLWLWLTFWECSSAMIVLRLLTPTIPNRWIILCENGSVISHCESTCSPFQCASVWISKWIITNKQILTRNFSKCESKETIK